MNDREEIEKVLRSFEHVGDPAVGRAVMAAYRSSFQPIRRPLWVRRIPFYAAVVAVLVSTAIAFFAGRWIAFDGRPFGAGKAAQNLTWSTAEEDLL